MLDVGRHPSPRLALGRASGPFQPSAGPVALWLALAAVGGVALALVVSGPPREAAVSGPGRVAVPADARCVAVARALRPRIEAHEIRARWTAGKPGDDRIARAYAIASSRCEGGRTAVSLASFEAISNMLARAEAAHPVAD